MSHPCITDHAYHHEVTSFHHMIHRMLATPMSSKSVIEEIKQILEVVRLNGYTGQIINSLIHKRKRTLQPQTFTKLNPDQQLKKRITLRFNQISLCYSESWKGNMIWTCRNTRLKALKESTEDAINQMDNCDIPNFLASISKKCLTLTEAKHPIKEVPQGWRLGLIMLQVKVA